MMICEAVQKEMTTCVYVTKEDKRGGYRRNGIVCVWDCDTPACVGDDIIIQCASSNRIIKGKIMSIFKVFAEDAQHNYKAFKQIPQGCSC